jgi:hypothetical protein
MTRLEKQAPEVTGVTSAGPLRLAAAACPSRYKGTSRMHIESDLRIYFNWFTDHDLNLLEARRADVELYVRWSQEMRRFRPSTISRRLSVVAGFYHTCVIDGLLEHSPADHVRRPHLPADSPTLGLSHLQFEALPTAARHSPDVHDFDLVAMLGLLGLRVFEATGSDITDLGENVAWDARGRFFLDPSGCGQETERRQRSRDRKQDQAQHHRRADQAEEDVPFPHMVPTGVGDRQDTEAGCEQQEEQHIADVCRGALVTTACQSQDHADPLYHAAQGVDTERCERRPHQHTHCGRSDEPGAVGDRQDRHCRTDHLECDDQPVHHREAHGVLGDVLGVGAVSEAVGDFQNDVDPCEPDTAQGHQCPDHGDTSARSCSGVGQLKIGGSGGIHAHSQHQSPQPPPPVFRGRSQSRASARQCLPGR